MINTDIVADIHLESFNQYAYCGDTNEVFFIARAFILTNASRLYVVKRSTKSKKRISKNSFYTFHESNKNWVILQ
jgi:hypothetical protein